MTDDTRLRAMLPTVLELSDRGAIVLLLSHFGRPKGEAGPICRPPSWCCRSTGWPDARCVSSRIARVPKPSAAITTMLPGQYRRSREHAVPPRRGEERSGAGQGHGRARRLLCRRCLLDRAPGARLDRGHHPFSAELRRAGDGGRAQGARSARWAIPSGRSRRWSAAPRSRPSSPCSAILSARSII